MADIHKPESVVLTDNSLISGNISSNQNLLYLPPNDEHGPTSILRFFLALGAPIFLLIIPLFLFSIESSLGDEYEWGYGYMSTEVTLESVNGTNQYSGNASLVGDETIVGCFISIEEYGGEAYIPYYSDYQLTQDDGSRLHNYRCGSTIKDADSISYRENYVGNLSDIVVVSDPQFQTFYLDNLIGESNLTTPICCLNITKNGSVPEYFIYLDSRFIDSNGAEDYSYLVSPYNGDIYKYNWFIGGISNSSYEYCGIFWPEDPFKAAVYSFIAEYKLNYGTAVGCYADEYHNLTYENVAFDLEDNWNTDDALVYAQQWVDSNSTEYGQESFNLSTEFNIISDPEVNAQLVGRITENGDFFFNNSVHTPVVEVYYMTYRYIGNWSDETDLVQFNDGNYHGEQIKLSFMIYSEDEYEVIDAHNVEISYQQENAAFGGYLSCCGILILSIITTIHGFASKGGNLQGIGGLLSFVSIPIFWFMAEVFIY